MTVTYGPVDLDTLKIDFPNVRSELDDEVEMLRLGESLAKKQLHDIIVHEDGRIFDGNRRVRAAIRKGLKKLNAAITDEEMTPERLKQIQLISDAHKKSLSHFDRCVALVAIKAATRGMTGRQLAALLDMDETLVSKGLSIEKLGPMAYEAFKSGKLTFTAMVTLAKLSHADQDKVLASKGKHSREELQRQARELQAGGQAALKTPKLRCPLPNGQVVTVVGGESGVGLEEALEALRAAISAIRDAINENWNPKTAMSAWRDSTAKAGV